MNHASHLRTGPVNRQMQSSLHAGFPLTLKHGSIGPQEQNVPGRETALVSPSGGDRHTTVPQAAADIAPRTCGQKPLVQADHDPRNPLPGLLDHPHRHGCPHRQLAAGMPEEKSRPQTAYRP